MIKNSIGTDAGIIWQLLLVEGRLSINEIEVHSGIEVIDLGLALGWLARENKVCFTNENNKSYVELTNTPTDIYY